MFPPVAKPADFVEELITPSSQSPRDSTPPPDLEGNINPPSSDSIHCYIYKFIIKYFISKDDHYYDLPYQEENPMSPGTAPPSLAFTRPGNKYYSICKKKNHARFVL